MSFLRRYLKLRQGSAPEQYVSIISLFTLCGAQGIEFKEVSDSLNAWTELGVIDINDNSCKFNDMFVQKGGLGGPQFD